MKRVLSVGLVVLALVGFAFVPALVADDKGAKDTPTFSGKISKVDATKHELILTDVKATGTTEKSATADKSTTADKDKLASYTFDVAENAKITLDGKTCELKDLKEGTFARVWTMKAEKADKADKTEKDKGLAVPHLKTDHIEAFTKEPPAATKDK
jgi:hypothetical protein